MPVKEALKRIVEHAQDYRWHPEAVGLHPGGQGRTGARTSDQPFLIFWFFSIKGKER